MPFLQVKEFEIDSFFDFILRYYTHAGQHFEALPILLAFSPARAVFETLKPDKSFLVNTDQGRVFSPEGELKWRRIGDQMRIVFLGDDDPPKGLDDRTSELTDLNKNISELVLWGVRTALKNEWIEQQVPHRFQYPIASTRYSKGRSAVVIENWKDAFGVTRFSRYHSIKEISGDKNAEK